MQLRSNRTLDKYLGYLLIAVLLPVTRLLGITLRRDHSGQTPPQYILFVKLLGLGSLVVATDAIQAMRQRYPHARFILLTDQNIANGIAPFGVFDELWAIDTSNVTAVVRGSVRYVLACWRLRGLWVVDLEVYSKLTTVYALLTMARNRFGFHLPPVFFRKYLNTHNVLFDQSAFLEDNYCKMAKAVTAQVTLVPAVRTNDERAKPYILFNNTCSDLALTRKLPDQTVAAISSWILEHTDYQLAFMGAPKDKAAIDYFITQHATLYTQQHRLLNIAGAFDFGSYYRFMADQGACLISIDSAPLHIARKLGLPTVSVWGPTDPGNHLKVHDEQKDLFVYQALPCSPCVHRTEQLPCGGDNVCMKGISADVVIEQVRTLLHTQRIKPYSPALIR